MKYEKLPIYFYSHEWPWLDSMDGTYYLKEQADECIKELRAQLAASHPRQDHSGAGQETRDALAACPDNALIGVVEAAREDAFFETLKLVEHCILTPPAFEVGHRKETADDYASLVRSLATAESFRLIAAALRTAERK
jgi:hypothetical protein